MRIKTPTTLVTFPTGRDIAVYNYLTGEAVTCAVQDTYWLSIASDWTDTADIVAQHPNLDPESLLSTLEQLVDLGLLLNEGTTTEQLHSDYEAQWEMGRAAGLFHFTVMDNQYLGINESIQKQKEKAADDPSPVLYWKNDAEAICLPAPASSDLTSVLQKRRTSRTVENTPITLNQLSQILHSGLGITGFVKTETSILPLKMAPSGGARNGYEAFVWVQNVNGLGSGVYHYSALEHSIAKVNAVPNALPRTFLQDQDWADAMPAIIFLVAVLERVSWKYTDPNAYRAVLIEGGHIAQNMMLACAENGLSICPTIALSHSRISELLNLKRITHTPVYALMVGKPAESNLTYYSIDEAREHGVF